jgi:UDP-glucose:(heptosyl)LPS alpha-1,3-glucosyltransferase
MSWQGDIPAGIAVHTLPQKGWFNFMRYQRFIDASFAIIQSKPV